MFILSAVRLVISVLISYSKWMYYHFSLAKGGPKKWHIRTFSTRKADIYNTDTGVKINWRCKNRKCKQFLFFPYKSVFDQISTKFRRNSTNVRPIVVVGEMSQSAKRRVDQMSHSTKRCFDEIVFDQMSWIPVI